MTMMGDFKFIMRELSHDRNLASAPFDRLGSHGNGRSLCWINVL
jgi:hypothetical protein